MVTILALGGLLLPALLKDGYGDRFSLGLLTGSAALGLLLPPASGLAGRVHLVEIGLDLSGVEPAVVA